MSKLCLQERNAKYSSEGFKLASSRAISQSQTSKKENKQEGIGLTVCGIRAWQIAYSFR